MQKYKYLYYDMDENDSPISLGKQLSTNLVSQVDQLKKKKKEMPLEGSYFAINEKKHSEVWINELFFFFL